MQCEFEKITIPCNMSNISNQHTLNTDGSLKSPSKTLWFNDPDDETPITPTSQPPASNISASQLSSLSSLGPSLSAHSVNKFFTHLPIKKVTGICQSHCVCRPFKQIADPDNAEVALMSVNDGESGKKHKFKSINIHCVTHKIVEDDLDGDVGSEYTSSHDGTKTASIEEDGDEEDIADATILDAKYTSMKALRDGDCQVIDFCFSVTLLMPMFSEYTLKA